MTTAPPKRPPLPNSSSPEWDSARLLEAARGDAASAIGLCRSVSEGLTQAEAEQRLTITGPNEIAAYKPEGWHIRLFHALRNPLVILLAALAALALATGDLRAATVMALMIGLRGHPAVHAGVPRQRGGGRAPGHDSGHSNGVARRGAA